MLLLTDATVMCQDNSTPHWWKLTPDITGSYANGTWAQLADLPALADGGPNAPLYFASAVLRDGRVFVAGGEYNNGQEVGLCAAQIYDPVANTWTAIGTPPGWPKIGDASCCVFPDGRVFLGYVGGPQCAIYDPVANAWAPAANMLSRSTNEETWTLLQDQTIMACDCFDHPATEKYLIDSDQWISCGNTPADLVEASSAEIGPASALPDRRLFAVGATGQTALYTMPSIPGQAGSWALGPTFPVVSGQQLGAKDAPACLLPNGLVLCAVGPVDGVNTDYLSPTYFYEFDPTTNTLNATNDPATANVPPFATRLLLLPTAQVLFANGQVSLQAYSPSGAPDPGWKPNITSVPTSLMPGSTYTLKGMQINGLSQAVSYGDDATMATNYPIVRIRNNTSGHVFYCRTFNHSTMAVNTGKAIHSTQFTVPWGAELGESTITVIANGIASDSVAVTVAQTMTSLSPGQQLLPGQSLQSNNKLHTFIMQQDGNAVLYDRNSKPLWSTKTGGLITPRAFVMQADGNLVLYSTDGQARWASNTYKNPGAFFKVQDDGNLVVYRAGSLAETANNALWAAASNDPWNLASQST